MQLALCQKILWSQLDAALLTVESCVRACPDASWNAPVANLKLCQVAFHALFFADFYLASGEDQKPFRQQPFHVKYQAVFYDYEELEDRPQVNLYERAFILQYLVHCRRKAKDVIFAETDASLSGDSGFSWRKTSRAELHVYNARHVQHHAAQMSLRLRLDAGLDIPWVGRGTELPQS